MKRTFNQTLSIAPLQFDELSRFYEQPELPAMEPPTMTLRDATFQDLSKYFVHPLVDAARLFGVCTTKFKKKCREVGINRWPFRKVKCALRAMERSSGKTQASLQRHFNELHKPEFYQQQEEIQTNSQTNKQYIAAPIPHRLLTYSVDLNVPQTGWRGICTNSINAPPAAEVAEVKDDGKRLRFQVPNNGLLALAHLCEKISPHPARSASPPVPVEVPLDQTHSPPDLVRVVVPMPANTPLPPLKKTLAGTASVKAAAARINALSDYSRSTPSEAAHFRPIETELVIARWPRPEMN